MQPLPSDLTRSVRLPKTVREASAPSPPPVKDLGWDGICENDWDDLSRFQIILKGVGWFGPRAQGPRVPGPKDQGPRDRGPRDQDPKSQGKCLADFLGRVVWLIIVGRISLAEFLGGISWRQCLVEFLLAEFLLVEYFGRISWPYFLSEFLLGAPKFGPPSRRTLSRASGGIFSIFIFSVDLCQASAQFTNEMHKRLRIRLTCGSLNRKELPTTHPKLLRN